MRDIDTFGPLVKSPHSFVSYSRVLTQASLEYNRTPQVFNVIYIYWPNRFVTRTRLKIFTGLKYPLWRASNLYFSSGCQYWIRPRGPPVNLETSNPKVLTSEFSPADLRGAAILVVAEQAEFLAKPKNSRYWVGTNIDFCGWMTNPKLLVSFIICWIIFYNI